MSETNLKLVQGLYDAFKAGAIDKVIAGLSADVDWQALGRPKDFPTIGRWRGPSGVQEFFRTVADAMDVTEFTPQTFAAANDKVFVQGRYLWTVRKSGKPAEAEWCHIFTVKNGKVTQFREFTDTAAFAEAYRG